MIKNKNKTSVESEVQYGSISLEKVSQLLDASAGSLTADDVDYQEKVEKCLITTKKMYPTKEYILKVKGIPTLSIGDIHMIQAQAKQGKTTLVTICVASVLAGQWGVVTYALERPPKVVIFDTEQFECDTFRQYETIMRQGAMEKEDLNKLSIYNMRGLDYEERRKFIRMVIQKEKPMLAIIDGIRDLVPDINDPVVCPSFVQELMRLASEVGCAILGVLHNNPGEGKARGWLGTEYINKCGYSFEPQKDGQVVTVKNPIYRGAPVPDWQFTFAPDGTPIVDESVVQHFLQFEADRKRREAEEAKAQKEKAHLDIVTSVLKNNNNALSRSELVKHITEMNIDGFGRQKIYDLIKDQLKAQQPPFCEISGKMVLNENYVQTEIPLAD